MPQHSTHLIYFFDFFQKIKYMITRMDMFGEPISLYLYEKKRFSTFYGGFLSLTLIIALLILTQSKFMNFYVRSNTSISKYEKISTVPPKIDMNNRFALSMNPLMMNSLTGKRYFDFLIKYSKYEFFENGTWVRTTQDIEVEQCNTTHFPMLSQEELNNSGINYWICPNFQSQDFFIEGTFSQKIYNYIAIYVAECNNTNGSDSYCANKEEIEEIKKNQSGKLYVNLKIINNLINLEDYSNPYTPYIDNVAFLINTDKLFVQKEIYLNELTILTDQTRSFNFLRDDENSVLEKIFTFNKNIETFSINEKMIDKNKTMYTAIFLRSSQLSQVYKRKYDSFQDYLQTVGALFSILYLISKLLVQKLTTNLLNQKVAKSIYYFPQKNKKNKAKNKISEGTILNYSPFKEKFFKFKQIIINKFKAMCYNDKNLGFKKSDINKALVTELDLIQLLRKMKELNNFKKLFLTKEQQTIFEFASKSNFIKSSNNLLVSTKKKSKIYLNVTKFLIFRF